MSYQSGSFVADEQPTTAKWNILWNNDASFNDGTGIGDDTILTRHVPAGELFENFNYQTDNNNSIASTSNAEVKVQAGWAQEAGNNAQSMTANVSFPVAFGTILGVICQLNAVKPSSAATAITDLTAAYNTSGTTFAISASAVATSGFTANISRNASTFASTTFYGFSWLAWGIA